MYEDVRHGERKPGPHTFTYNPFSNSCSSAILKSAFLPKNHFIMNYWMDNCLKGVPWSVLKHLGAIKWYETIFLSNLYNFYAFWSNFACKMDFIKASLRDSLRKLLWAISAPMWRTQKCFLKPKMIIFTIPRRFSFVWSCFRRFTEQILN